MRPLSAIILIGFLAVGVSYSLTNEPRSESSTALKDAVTTFNTKARQNHIGMNQPVLTEDEVIAAIRGWIRKEHPVSDEIYDAFQKIAETGQLPKKAVLDYTTSLSG